MDIIGKTVEELQAELKAARSRSPVRVVEEDGEAFVVTDDYVANRINVKVSNGLITEYYFG